MGCPRAQGGCSSIVHTRRQTERVPHSRGKGIGSSGYPSQLVQQGEIRITHAAIKTPPCHQGAPHTCSRFLPVHRGWISLHYERRSVNHERPRGKISVTVRPVRGAEKMLLHHTFSQYEIFTMKILSGVTSQSLPIECPNRKSPIDSAADRL